MSTKFVSKMSNYALVLKPGVEGNRALGTHAIPGIYVKFSGGVVDVKEEKIIEMLREHPSFGVDFLEIKEDEVDPYSDVRSDIEPEHFIQEMKYGHAVGVQGSKKTKMSPELKRLIESEAVKMLPNLLKSNPDILKDIIKDMAKDMKDKEEKLSSKLKPEAKTETKEKGIEE